MGAISQRTIPGLLLGERPSARRFSSELRRYLMATFVPERPGSWSLRSHDTVARRALSSRGFSEGSSLHPVQSWGFVKLIVTDRFFGV
jgi:hypothetical protein